MRNATRRGLVLLVMGVMLAGLAGEASARAGRGGSRGSRSYSSPARPAPLSPGSPASPSRSLNNPAPAPSPAARPGLFGGGLMGALGGFMLGGLLGSLLFGGLGGLGSGLGFGLMDMLLVGGGLFLLFRFMKSRQTQPQPAYAGSAAYAGGGPRAADVPAGGGVAAQERPSALDELERGLSHVRQMDAGFDAAALASDAAETFRAVQAALTAGDMSPLRPRLTSEMLERLQMQCTELRRSGHTNHVERIQIERAEVTEAWQERGRDYVTVILGGSLVDYTLDDARGTVVNGSRNPERFEEYWTFTRPVGPNAWTLTAIQAG
jgi:predicted lipid-binding transport protein (Tim44 family)